MGGPVRDSLNFFRSQIGKNKLRIWSLPGQRLGFIQGEVEQMFVRFKQLVEFSQDAVLCLIYPGNEFLAGGQADFGEVSVGCGFRVVRFHNRYSVVVYLVKFTGKLSGWHAFGRLDSEQFASAGESTTGDFQIVLDARLGELALVIREERSRLGGGIRHVDQTGGVGIANG